MSKKRYRQMVEDRNLRDAALALVKADVAHLRKDMSAKEIGGRIANRASDGALEVFDEAAEVASNNRGILATLVAAIFVWFARNPIMELFADNDEDEYDDEDELGETTDEEPETEYETDDTAAPADPEAPLAS